jgi:hypothetical protein
MRNTLFPFIGTVELREHYVLGKFWEAKLKQELPSPLYWIQPDKKILWNFRLIQSYLLNGLESSQHQALVEEYLTMLNQVPEFSPPAKPRGRTKKAPQADQRATRA